MAYALAGRMDLDIVNEPLGNDKAGKPVYLRDIWPTPAEVESTMRSSVSSDMFRKEYADVYTGDAHWKALPIPEGDLYAWDPKSTYIQDPPFFHDMPRTAGALKDLTGLRALAVLGDSVTTDHISPAGSIPADTPAGKYLISRGVQPKDFNSYGARRGNHEVMMRGTFANIRLRNALAPGTEGGWTIHQPSGEKMSIYDAAMKYRENASRLSSSPAKNMAPALRATGPPKEHCYWAFAPCWQKASSASIAATLSVWAFFRSNFLPDENLKTLGLTGLEIFDIDGLAHDFAPRKKMKVRARSADGKEKTFTAITRVDTPFELAYYQHGGILQYVLRQML